MQANWTVLKTPECSNAIKSRLYRNLGLLYAAKGDYKEALRQLADDVSRLAYITCIMCRWVAACCQSQQTVIASSDST